MEVAENAFHRFAQACPTRYEKEMAVAVESMERAGTCMVFVVFSLVRELVLLHVD